MSGGASKLAELNMFTTAMPKGGDLHHHYSGAIYVEIYLDWLAKLNYCVYGVDNSSLTIEKYTVESNPSRLSSAVKSSCLTADQIRADNDFYRELLKRWSDADYANHYHEQPPPDKQFFDTFAYFSPINMDSNYNVGLMWIKNRALDENIQYIETMLRGGPNFAVSSSLDATINALTSQTSDTNLEKAFTSYYNLISKNTTISNSINTYIKSIETAMNQINDANFTLRFQSYVTRSNSPARIFTSLYSAFTAVTRSNFIVGVNIVGPENGIVAMRDYTLHMKMFRFFKQQHPSVKLAMHAGELVMGMVPPEGLQFHIRQAVEIAGASRIGHGIDIFYERDSYDLLKKMKDSNVAVEAILSSNQFILGVENNEHPLLVYRAFNVPLIIATDDAGVSRSTLSNEYLMFSDRYKPSYTEVKTLVYNSIRYSFLNDSDKQTHLNDLDARFIVFEQKMADIANVVNHADSLSSKMFLFSFIIFFFSI